jgi:hypothetical protein
MLPSAVNDTMRDMMAQIRDVGDGIRGGTYTMTAPIITGGTITGVALTGNTFTSPVISGGSINNTPIGATTANTGKFSTLTNAALTSGRVTYAGTSGVLQDDADFTFNGTTVTMANDASISGLTVGKGAGAISTNTALGASAFAANTTGSNGTAVGQLSLQSNTTGVHNTAVGRAVLNGNTTGQDNTGLGSQALDANSTGSANTALGRQALQANTTASDNTAVGYQAGYTNQTGNRNTFLGNLAGYTSNVSGNASNTAIGYTAGYALTTGTTNTFIGNNSGSSITTGTQNSILGSFNGNQDGLNISTASNYVVLSIGNGKPLVSTALSQTVALENAVPNSGTGITFPATQSASSNANTLDDYEEGTFTPTATGSTTAGTTTYVAQKGFYTKIGRLVTVNINLYWTALTGTGNLQIGGLPFTSATTADNYSVGTCLSVGLNWTSGTQLSTFLLNNSAAALIYCSGDDINGNYQGAVNEQAELYITLSYTV